MAAFEELGILSEIAKAVDEMEWSLPTDVQAEAIPLVLGGGDVLMAAETGSGKTGAFCMPILQIVHETLQTFAEGKGSKIIRETSPKWTLSFFDRGSALAVTPDGLRCQSREFKEWHGARATKGVKDSGKWFYEVVVADEGLCRVGWSCTQATLDLGTDMYGFGFGGTGKKSNNKQFDDYGEAFGKSDVIGCCLNLDGKEIKFTKNGIDFGIAFRIPPSMKGFSFFPAVVMKNAEMQLNFGDESFRFPPPEGFVAVAKATGGNLVVNQVGTVGSLTGNKKINNAPQAIIIEPSRELAEQTYSQLEKFKKYLENSISILLVVGGVGIKEQINCLNTGVDIVVGTPGRLEELISVGHMSLTQCKFFVLDEADGLLKQGYTHLIDRLYKQIPKVTSDGRRLQMIVCSATLHDFEVKKMAERIMHFPTWVDLKGEDTVPDTVHHVVVLVDPQRDRSWDTLRNVVETDGVHGRDTLRGSTPENLSEAVKLLKAEYCRRAIDQHKMDRALIFCRTKLDCDNLERYLRKVGSGSKYSCACLHADRKPDERKANLARFKKGEVKLLICTDVAARGIDVTGLPYVINVTLPDEKSNYVHRIGRVGRAERMGLALSLVSTVPEKVWYHGQWCKTRGQNCHNTNLTDVKGCCIWYNEQRYLAEIEDHLNVTIEQVGPDMEVPVNDFDGVVVYGQRKGKDAGTGYQDHVVQMAPAVRQLANLESQAQLIFLKRHLAKDLV